MKSILFIYVLFISVNSFAQSLYSEKSIIDYWELNGMDTIEGIYESNLSFKDVKIPCSNKLGITICYSSWRIYQPKYKLAMIKLSGEYKLIYLSEKQNIAVKIDGCDCDYDMNIEQSNNNWRIGDIKAQLYQTVSPDIFKCDWYLDQKSINPECYITIGNNSDFTMHISDEKFKYSKIFPTNKDTLQYGNKNVMHSSGTGFAISSNGLIVTNYHVTNGRTGIKVRGINGDFLKRYAAKVLVEDKNNDLSIIQITDSSFKSLGIVPYTISSKSSDVGSSVFTLGYPLMTVMGDEIKLTNGIISSKSGFKGDITSYQISVPIQPGNSGGPLFDENGNVVGILNSKLTNVDGVSYAIKSSYLLNLAESLSDQLTLQSANILSGKPLTSQVKILNKFVYIIELN